MSLRRARISFVPDCRLIRRLSFNQESAFSFLCSTFPLNNSHHFFFFFFSFQTRNFHRTTANDGLISLLTKLQKFFQQLYYSELLVCERELERCRFFLFLTINRIRRCVEVSIMKRVEILKCKYFILVSFEGYIRSKVSQRSRRSFVKYVTIYK